MSKRVRKITTLLNHTIPRKTSFLMCTVISNCTFKQQKSGPYAIGILYIWLALNVKKYRSILEWGIDNPERTVLMTRLQSDFLNTQLNTRLSLVWSTFFQSFRCARSLGSRHGAPSQIPCKLRQSITEQGNFSIQVKSRSFAIRAYIC